MALQPLVDQTAKAGPAEVVQELRGTGVHVVSVAGGADIVDEEVHGGRPDDYHLIGRKVTAFDLNNCAKALLSIAEANAVTYESLIGSSHLEPLFSIPSEHVVRRSQDMLYCLRAVIWQDSELCGSHFAGLGVFLSAVVVDANDFLAVERLKLRVSDEDFITDGKIPHTDYLIGISVVHIAHNLAVDMPA